jgi:hypothetical protein
MREDPLWTLVAVFVPFSLAAVSGGEGKLRKGPPDA